MSNSDFSICLRGKEASRTVLTSSLSTLSPIANRKCSPPPRMPQNSWDSKEGLPRNTKEYLQMGPTDQPSPSPGRKASSIFLGCHHYESDGLILTSTDTDSKSQTIRPARAKPKRPTIQPRGGTARRKIHPRSLMTALMALPLDLIYDVGRTIIYRHAKPIADVYIHFHRFSDICIR